MNDKRSLLEHHGFTIGDRDPGLNRHHKGKYMVHEHRNKRDKYPTDNAEYGPFCIVGDNIDFLIDEAYDFMMSHYIMDD